MRAQTLLIGSLFLVTALAGCFTPVAEDDPEKPENRMYWEANHKSHPAFNWPTADNLPTMGHDYYYKVNGEALPFPADWHLPEPKNHSTHPDELHHVMQVADIPTGAGIDLFGPYAFVGSYTEEAFHIVHIGETPAVLDSFPAQAGDIRVIAYPPSAEYPEGLLLATTSTRAADVVLLDVTDPMNITLVGTITTTQGNHNHAVVPGTPILYNAPSTGSEQVTLLDGSAPTGKNDIWDLSDPYNPVHVQDFENGYGCHAIDFYIDAANDTYLAFCAGVEVTQIWDVTDPYDPVVISEVAFPVGGSEQTGGGISPVSFSHLAMANHDGTVMIVGDETGGGLAPGCDAQPGPLGNVWFYDISDPVNPERQGQYSPNAAQQHGGCTAHFGDVIDGQDLLLMSYYTAGVALVDFSDPNNPVEKALWSPYGPSDVCSTCGVWDVQYYQGHVFTGDISRGMDYLHLN